MIGVLKAGCLMFLWAADPFARAATIRRFATLLMDQPTDATVTANFRT